MKLKIKHRPNIELSILAFLSLDSRLLRALNSRLGEPSSGADINLLGDLFRLKSGIAKSGLQELRQGLRVGMLTNMGVVVP